MKKNLGNKYLITSPNQKSLPADGEFWLPYSQTGRSWSDDGNLSPYTINSLPDPYESAFKNSTHYARIFDLSQKLVSEIYVRLNRVHGLDLPKEYWKVHLGMWAMTFVIVVYDRLTRLENAKVKLGNFNLISYGERQDIFISNTMSFTNAAREDDLNNLIYTLIANELSISCFVHENLNAQSVSNRSGPAAHAVGKASGQYPKLLGMLARRADILMVSSYLPRKAQLALAILSAGRILPLPAVSPAEGESSRVDPIARDCLGAKPDGDDRYFEIIVKLAGRLIPQCFVESFGDNRAAAKLRYDQFKPKAIFSTNCWWYDEIFKHWAAESKLRGCSLIGGEHGPYVFYDYYDLCSQSEIDIVDFYLTWGWADRTRPQIRPTPANKVVGSRKYQPRGQDRILYVTTDQPLHTTGYLEPFGPHLKKQGSFFSKLSPTVAKSITVRLPRYDHGWGMKGAIAAASPHVLFDDHSLDFSERIKQVRLCIFDYLSTTFPEALAYNVPSVIFLDTKLMPIRAEAEVVFDRLRLAKIVHDTPCSAREWVEEIHSDPQKWWNEARTQEAVTLFCSSFARTSNEPIGDWKMTLMNIITKP